MCGVDIRSWGRVLNPTRAGGGGAPQSLFVLIFSALEKDTGIKIGDFSYNFMGNILICVSADRLLLW